MQNPPGGEFSQPPQPNYAPSGPYSTDKVVGIIIMVLSIICAGFSGLVVLGGGILAGAGATGAATSTGSVGAGAVGGIIMIMGVVMLLVSVINVVSGYGIMKSLRWGFILAAIMSAISILLNLANPAKGFFAIIYGGAILAYCIMRLTGKTGPAPL